LGAPFFHKFIQREVLQSVLSRGTGSRVLERRRRRESGQGLVEYALILIMVSIVAIFILISMGSQLNSMFSDIVSVLPPH
jgi:pilus assembly protein Flp/PilA